MNLLIDTQILIWAAFNPNRLTRNAASALSNEKHTILLSAASAWELATKVRIGKLPGAERLEADLMNQIQRAGYTWLPMTPEIALRAGRLVGTHKDPFDRVIAAQALDLDIDLISNDAKLDQFHVRRIW